DWLTVEGHGEASVGLLNAGGGAVATFRRFGTLSGALSASAGPAGFGAQAYLGFESRLMGMTINISSLHALGDYGDLASYAVQMGGLTTAGVFGAQPTRALDRITV